MGSWRWPLAALAGLTLLRLLLCTCIALSPDETYYWIWSRALAPGYLDHPPMVALFIRAGTALFGDTALGVRLAGPLAAALGSVLLALAAIDLLPELGLRAGIAAAALMNATLVFAVGSIAISPDTPLLLFWTATIWALGRWLRTGQRRWWLAAGISAGVALDSKYTAFLLLAGIGVWVLAAARRRAWLRAPWPWLAACLTLAGFAPVLLWNAAHDWASFAKQGVRTGAWQPARALQFLAEFLGAQLGLATPLIFVLCLTGIGLAVRRARDPGYALLAALSALPALVFVEHALGDRVQGNWPVVIYPAAAIAAAGLTGRFWERLRAPALALGAVLTALVYVQAVAAPLTLPHTIDPTMLRLAGWDTLSDAVEAVRRRTGADFVACDGYGPASELAWHLPRDVTMVGIEPRWALFDLPRPALAGRVGLLVRSARRADDPDTRPWATITEIGTVDRGRDGVIAERFRLYRVVGRASDAAAVILPHPR